MSSITNPPSKILLNQSTAMSLNDRFSQYAKVRRTPTSSATTTVSSNIASKRFNNFKLNNNNAGRINNFIQKNASNRNKRLALQMANRPSVQAALRIKKKSIQQRLGAIRKQQQQQNVGGGMIGRLNSRGRGIGLRGGKGILRQRIGRGGAIRRRGTNIQSRLGGGINISRRGGFGVGRRGGLNRRSLRSRLGNMVTDKSNNGQSNLANRRNAIAAAGGRFYNRGNRRMNRGNNNRRGGNRGRGRGNRGNQSQSQQQQQQQKPKSKETLDTDLDQYMAKSKTQLNADLDQYMTQTN